LLSTQVSDDVTETSVCGDLFYKEPSFQQSSLEKNGGVVNLPEVHLLAGKRTVLGHKDEHVLL